MRTTAIVLMAAFVAATAPAQAKTRTITDKTPYYMCFVYTPDGTLFAGGDFNHRRANRMLSENCSQPKSLTTVLMKTIAIHEAGKTRNYATK